MLENASLGNLGCGAKVNGVPTPNIGMLTLPIFMETLGSDGRAVMITHAGWFIVNERLPNALVSNLEMEAEEEQKIAEECKLISIEDNTTNSGIRQMFTLSVKLGIRFDSWKPEAHHPYWRNKDFCFIVLV